MKDNRDENRPDILILPGEIWAPSRPPPRKAYEYLLSRLRLTFPQGRIVSVVGYGKARNLPGPYFEEVEKKSLSKGHADSLSSGLSVCQDDAPLWVFINQASTEVEDIPLIPAHSSVALARKPKHKNWGVGFSVGPEGKILNFSYGMPYNWLGAFYLSGRELGLFRKVCQKAQPGLFAHECLNQVIALGGVLRPEEVLP